MSAMRRRERARRSGPMATDTQAGKPRCPFCRPRFEPLARCQRCQPLRSLHRLRPQGRDNQASWVSRCAHWVHAVPGGPISSREPRALADCHGNDMGPPPAQNSGFQRVRPTFKNPSKPSGAGYDLSARCEPLRNLGPRYGDGDLFALKFLDRHRVQGSDPTHPVLA